VDTYVDSVVDLVPSPAYDHDKTLFAITEGGDFSLWRSDAQGWQRLMFSIEELSLVAVSPEYGVSSRVVYVSGVLASESTIWRSLDGGDSFNSRQVPLTVLQWAVASDEMFYIAASSGLSSVVYYTVDGGVSYSTPVAVGIPDITSLALSPAFEDDDILVVGNENGRAYWSQDGGQTFRTLGNILSGELQLAFDAGFEQNRFVYATSPADGVFRIELGSDLQWLSISDDDDGPELPGVMAAYNGLLYVADLVAWMMTPPRAACALSGAGGRDDLPAGGRRPGRRGVLSRIWTSGNRIWADDTANNMIMVFADLWASR
jgi:hypothetical protein